jgi:RimJ/RimL family protein N-acetyltransferase
MGIIIYKKEGDAYHEDMIEVYSMSTWKPSLLQFIPPGLPGKYVFWWLMHYFSIFKNKNYSAVIAKDNSKIVGIIVLSPAYFRWKFMNNNDLQITNVFVNSDYRGKGIAYQMINHAIKNFSLTGRVFWYITTQDNIPSMKLSKKAGFQLAGKGLKINKTGIKGLSEIKLVEGV